MSLTTPSSWPCPAVRRRAFQVPGSVPGVPSLRASGRPRPPQPAHPSARFRSVPFGSVFGGAHPVTTNNAALHPRPKETKFSHKGENATVLRIIFLKGVFVYTVQVGGRKRKHTFQTTLQTKAKVHHQATNTHARTYNHLAF